MKKLFLLPLVAMFGLVGCNNGGGAKPWKSEEVVIPTVVASDLKTAYDAAAALQSGETEQMQISGVVVAKTGNSFYVQEGYCGMLVYGGKNAYEGVEVGKEVTISSTYQNYSSLVETKTIATVVAGDAKALPDSIKVLSNEQLAQLKQSILVNGVFEFVKKDQAWGDKANALVTAKFVNNGKTMEDEVTIKFDKYAYDETKAALVNALAEGKRFTITDMVTTAFKASAGGVSNQLVFCGNSVIA